MRKHLTYANVVSSLCLFVVLGGGAYAASTLPRNSVGSRQLKTSAVTSSKVKNHSLLAKDFRTGQLPKGAKGAPGTKGDKGDPGPTNTAIADGSVTTDKLAGAPAAAAVRFGAAETTVDRAATILHADTELFDTANMYASSAPQNLVAPVSGTYVVSATVAWDTNPTGYRRATILGPDDDPVATVTGPSVPGGSAITSQNVSGVERLAAGQSLSVEVAQASGGPLGATLSRFEAAFVAK